MSVTFVRNPMLRLTLMLALVLAALPPAPPARASWRSLTGVLPAHADITYGWQISPDSLYAIYIADVEQDGRDELYSVPLAGGPPVKLNGALVTGGRVNRFVVTADSQYVIYIADQEVDQRDELYRVPIVGGSAVKLNGALVSGGNVQWAKVDPDNVYVVYVADGEINDANEVYSVPILGGAIAKLTPMPVSGGDVNLFEIDRIGNRVVFSGDFEVDGRQEIYGVPIGGGTAVGLNPDGSTNTYAFRIDPGIQVVAFDAQPSGSSSTQLYMNATGGGLLTQLNVPLASNQDVFGFNITPDGARVIYNVTTMTSTLGVTSGNLYSVLIGGGSSTQITTAAAGYGVYGATFSITSDSQRVVYRHQVNASSLPTFESVSVTGSGRAVLFSETSGGESLYHTNVSANGQWVAYTTYPSFDAYSVPVAGGSSQILARGGFGPKITPDSSRVLFTTNRYSGDYDLYSSQIFGGDLRNVSRVGPDAQVTNWAISPDGQKVLYEVETIGGSTPEELRVGDGAEAPPPLYLPDVRK